MLIIIAVNRCESRKGTNGVDTDGATAKFMFFDRGTCWVLPLAYFYLPQRARAYTFPLSVKIHIYIYIYIFVYLFSRRSSRSTYTFIYYLLMPRPRSSSRSASLLRTLFPYLSKFIVTFAAAPSVLTPFVRSQSITIIIIITIIITTITTITTSLALRRPRSRVF